MKSFIFCLLLGGFHDALATPVKTQVLFVLFDAGETYALIPVLSHLNLEYKQLVMGTAKKLLEGDRHNIDFEKDCRGDAAHIRECVEAPLVIVGLASDLQLQIGRSYVGPNHKVIGYFDSMADIHVPGPRFKFFDSPFELWLPSKFQEEDVKKLFPKKIIHVVGQPALERWSEFKPLRNLRKIFSQYNPSLPTLLYAGGYGEHYREAFQLFLSSIKGIAKSYNIVVSAHPKTDGQLERTLIDESGLSLTLSKDIETMKIAFDADVVVSQSSSVGILSVFMGKSVIYLDLPGSIYSDFTIRKGLSTQTFTAEAFRKALAEVKSRPVNVSEVYEKGGIPPHSVNLIISKIKAELKTLTP